MPDPYKVIPIDPEDVEEGVKDPALLALRQTGYRTVAVLTVEHKGRPRLAFVMEPPVRSEPDPPPPLVLGKSSPISPLGVAVIALSIALLVAVVLLADGLGG